MSGAASGDRRSTRPPLCEAAANTAAATPQICSRHPENGEAARAPTTSHQPASSLAARTAAAATALVTDATAALVARNNATKEETGDDDDDCGWASSSENEDDDFKSNPTAAAATTRLLRPSRPSSLEPNNRNTIAKNAPEASPSTVADDDGDEDEVDAHDDSLVDDVNLDFYDYLEDTNRDEEIVEVEVEDEEGDEGDQDDDGALGIADDGDDDAINLVDDEDEGEPGPSDDPRQEKRVVDRSDADAGIAREGRSCHVCGLALSHLHYLAQVSHVKACVSRGGMAAHVTNIMTNIIGGGNGAGGAVQNKKNNDADDTRAPPQQQQQRGSSSLLSMSIIDWLRSLGLERFGDRFVAEEVDVTVVHALTIADLEALGIVDRVQQRIFMREAAKVGEERAAARKRRRKRPHGGQASAPAKKQATLKMVTMSGGNGHATGRSGGGRESGTNAKGAATKKAEAALLASLYPPRPTRNTGASVSREKSIRSRRDGDVDDDDHHHPSASPQPTPPLPSSRALAERRVPPEESLFASAGTCTRVTKSLESRIEARMAARAAAAATQAADGGGPSAPPAERLERGGMRYPPATITESREVKMMKLEALRAELATHEETVAELRRLIARLEAEIG